jgi:hypothetical protein
MATWIEDIIQALKNLGGQGTNEEIFAEVKRIRKPPLPKTWHAMIIKEIGMRYRDTDYFNGNDLFRKLDRGFWAFRDQAGTTPTPQPTRKPKSNLKQNPNPISPLSESFEEITNILSTIKQYRDYQNPDSASWKEYVKEFFHILGFSTEEITARLFTLNVMGSNHTPKAIVGFIHPGEDFEDIIPGLTWESHLFLAAKNNQIDWGILTNGLQLKVIHYKSSDNQQATFWPDLDGIIQNEKADTFFTIYKVFSYIKGQKDYKAEPRNLRKRINQGRRYAGVPVGLLNILEVCREIYENKKDFWRACEIVTQRNNLSSVYTIADACTRRIGLNTAGFRALIQHLSKYYPNFADEIKKEIGMGDV